MANLRIAELDFDQIKTNLKAFLNAQTEFSDYDFEGSSLSVLIDILAYNTHYNAYLANMMMNEMFLDSAVKKSSAVSLAKMLNYTPISVRGAIANLDVTVTSPTGLPPSITMERYTPFSTTVDGTSYTFLTNKTYTASRVGTTYTFTDVDVIEGSLQNFSFVASTPGPQEKYIIPSLSIDTTTLQVVVQTSATNTTLETFTLCTDITGIDNTSSIFFLEQNSQGKYEIYFGDGVLGKKLTAGNIITAKYIASSGTGANVSDTITQTFTASASIGGSNSITTVVNSNSSGGTDAETISSIKFNAPRVNATKNRAITADDFKTLIATNYSGAESIAVWGGEDNDPPYYGRVLISLKPFEGSFISDATKNLIATSILKERQMINIQPLFVDPDYLYIQLVVSANYNSTLTNLSLEGIKDLINTKITEYFNTNLNQFGKNLYSSQLTKFILEQNQSLVSITPVLKVQKRITPTLNAVNSYSSTSAIKFQNRIHPSELTSTKFYVNYDGTQTLVYLNDVSDTNPPDYSGTGTVYLVNSTSGTLLNSIGTVDYSTGVLTIDSLTPTGYITGQTGIYITANLQELNSDVIVSRNQIVVLDTSEKSAASGRNAGVEIYVSAIV